MTNNKADKSIKDTGERMVPAYHKGHIQYGEHLVRYEAAKVIVKGKVVLDIASGSGYGSAALAEVAKKVFGVDVDKDAIEYSNKNYKSKNLEFILGDGTKIPLEDNAVDVVVSFETIEHIEDYTTFMKEVSRVLKPDGVFILSTPNDIEFPESNHFHVHEFERKELQKLVDKFFKYTKNYYQGTWLYNALVDGEELASEWRQGIDTINAAPIKLDKCIYFYMLCSNRKITESVDKVAAIAQHYSERTIQEYENSVRDHIEEQGKIIKHLENEMKDKDGQLSQLREELNTIHDSKAWRTLRKVRSTVKKK